MSEVTAEMIERGRGSDPRSAAARRKRGAKVQQARERLTTSDTGHRGCDLELLRAYASTRLDSALSATALIVVVWLISYWWMGSNLVMLWGALTLASLILCCRAAKIFAALEDSKVHLRRWSVASR